MDDLTGIEVLVISSADRKPVKGSLVLILGEDAMGGPTEENGKISFLALAPGLYKISVSPPASDQTIWRDVTVEKGKTLLVQIAVEPEKE